ncbi:hypothetical protein KW798_02925 [Candidatus Parcubacteria bacterium]|nr:hypothetical protein [Candidatus Parcubacteria bacterium]
MSEPNTPILDELLALARLGTDEAWDQFSQKMGPQHLTPECVLWARKYGIIESDENVRDASATIIAHSDVPIDELDQIWLEGLMMEDDNKFVRHWLANALYKRGNRSSDVVTTWEEACKEETPAGEFARGLPKR